MRKNTHQAGFAILEVLIATLILSIGILGMAQMQAISLTISQSAHYRVQAQSIAEDLADRMRANRTYINLSRYQHPLISAEHDGFNVYSETDGSNFNNDVSSLGSANQQACITPLSEDSLTDFKLAMNCRAISDINEIKSKINPNQQAIDNELASRLLPEGTLFFVDCEDKLNPDMNNVEDDDPCSPGSNYSIFVIWPQKRLSNESQGNEILLNGRCVERLNQSNLVTDQPLLATRADCFILDLVP